MHKFPEWMGDEPRKNAPWPDSEVTQLRYGLIEGLTINQIAAIHGRTTGSIVSKIRKYVQECKHIYVLDCDTNYRYLFVDTNVGKPTVINCECNKKILSFNDALVFMSIAGLISVSLVCTVAILEKIG